MFFTLLKTKRNQILLREGDICEEYYFVNKCYLRLFTYNKEGIETTRYFAFELVQTIEPSELLNISRESFFHLVDTVRQFAHVYRKILEMGFITAQKRIYGFQGFDALEKVKWVIQYQPDFLARVSNKMAASY
jgi:hypothetical protein